MASPHQMVHLGKRADRARTTTAGLIVGSLIVGTFRGKHDSPREREYADSSRVREDLHPGRHTYFPGVDIYASNRPPGP
ncbi:hypothetical protein GCM10010116_48140 [Microbispora rosea subsp. aerata]|nr:hypothetical protein GCM10010116_48140 [Microbispora rosea subsp. aerata]GLJ86070.1 hypothetical protein GCM10017588_48030 [Microbispora rosea subsp. aerata]